MKKKSNTAVSGFHCKEIRKGSMSILNKKIETPMSKDTLIEMLYQYKRQFDSNDKEFATVDELINNIKHNTDFFVRKKIEGTIDVAASVLLLSQDLQEGLFLFHKKIKQWTMPGGHADGETDLYKVALKELQEEVGISIPQKSSAMPSFIYKFEYSPDIFG